MKKIYQIGLLALLFSTSGSLFANPFGPSYPAPGGNSFSGNGVSGANGTAIWNFSGLDNSAFDTLYYGLNQVDYGPAGAGLHNSPTTLNFSGVSGSTATWTANTVWLNPSTTSHQNVTTRLQITESGTGGWITDLASIGLDNTGLFGALGAVLDVSTGADFGISWAFEANVGSGWQALNSVSQHFSHDGYTHSSFATGFYWTESSVPEPSTLLLLSGGLIGIFSRKPRGLKAS